MSKTQFSRIFNAILVALLILVIVLIVGNTNIPPERKTLPVVALAVSLSFILANLFVGYGRKKWEEAKQYLLDSASGVYFYGLPLSECLKAGSVWRLNYEGIGDFALPVGILLMYVLQQNAQDEEPILYYDSSKTDVFVNFECGGQYWIYEVNSQALDDTTLRPARNSRMSYDRIEQTYWDISRVDRRNVENCVYPDQSDLPPDQQFVESTPVEFAATVKTIIRAHAR